MSEPGAVFPSDVREFGLVPEPTRLGLPLVFGVALGLTLLWSLQQAGVNEKLAVGAGLLWALVSATFVHALSRRRQPDRVRVSPEAVELARGAKTVRRVRLAKLSQVNELQTSAGPILLLADNRRALALGQHQLVLPRAYESITQLIVERMQALDPTGELSRRAVQAGRLSDVIVQRPVRVAPLLAGTVALASLLSLTVLSHAVATRPYPDVALGALSRPLVAAGESWRLFSYVFVHPDPLQLALAIFGLFWFAPLVERLVGWERTLVAFVAGAAGAALGQVALFPFPISGSGATGGVLGLIGMLAAVTTIGRRRLPRALLPNMPVWVAVGFYVLPVLLFGGLVLPAYPVGAAAGFLVGLLTLAGVELPPNDEARSDLRPFAYLALVALAIGLLGGAMHVKRPLAADDALVTEAYVKLPPNPATALVQNGISYLMLMRPRLSPAAVDDAARIAEAAVAGTGRKSPEVLDTLAVARYRQGRGADAKQLLQEALQLDQDPATRKVIERHLEEVQSGKPVSSDDETE